MIEIEKVRARLESEFSGGSITVENPQQDSEHFSVVVVYSGFLGKSLIEQHKMVYKALEKEMPLIHALSIKTKVE